MGSRLSAVAEGLVGILSSPRMAAGLEYGRVCNAWKQATGPAVAKVAMPIKLEGGRLRVAVKNSVWANEIQLMSEAIKVKLNETLGEGKVTEITVTVARFDDKI